MVYRLMHFSFFIIYLFLLQSLAFAESPGNSLPELFPVKTVETIALSPDGNFIACRFFEAIKVFSAYGTLVEKNLSSTQSMDWGIRFSPGGNYLVCNFPGKEGTLPLKL